jgi:hypothetical protein
MVCVCVGASLSIYTNITLIHNHSQSRVRGSFSGVTIRDPEPLRLNVGLQDLAEAHAKGKWWLVGHGWKGDQKKKEPKASSSASAVVLDGKREEKLLALARKHKMNTDVRRALFCVIMGSADYLDAYIKIHKLGLTRKQVKTAICVCVCNSSVNEGGLCGRFSVCVCATAAYSTGPGVIRNYFHRMASADSVLVCAKIYIHTYTVLLFALSVVIFS